jgi:hypothetical protein
MTTTTKQGWFRVVADSFATLSRPGLVDAIFESPARADAERAAADMSREHGCHFEVWTIRARDGRTEFTGQLGGE